ncbi:myb-like protein D [Aphis craccivora]|uniref:Myb-like protein D n=1 Tax=Aphis craccivora TaxID=307492 RepID=A0A6G0YLU8_APHCR|nr:myb-like protein D [Aphis craccivora]
MENTGASPLEVVNPSNKSTLESPDLSLEILNKTQQLIDLGSPSEHPSPSPSKRPSLFRSPSERQRAEVKHSLTRSLSLDHKKVTRSKVTDSFEHTELTFERRPRVKKMVTIKLEEAFKLIVNLVEEKFASNLIKYITTRLSGRALEMIKYKNVTKLVYIKSYLTDAFEDTTTTSSLQIQLNSIKMRYDEDVNDY